MTGKQRSLCVSGFKKITRRDSLHNLGEHGHEQEHSRINMLVMRGKRVVAEATIRKDVMKKLMRVDTRDLFEAVNFVGGRIPRGIRQQWRARGQRSDRDVHRDRSGRGEYLEIPAGVVYNQCSTMATFIRQSL